MKKIFIFVLLITCLRLSSYGQLQFQRTIGGINEEEANSIIQTSDGGYAIVGMHFIVVDSTYMYIAKIDVNGTLQWTRTIRVVGTLYNYANAIIQTTDGGYAVAGSITTYPWYGNMFIMKLNSSGILQWLKTISLGLVIGANSLILTTDGGFVVAGTASGTADSEMLITKLDSIGVVQWCKTIGGENYDGASSVKQTKDGGYVLAGYTYSFGVDSSDMYIAKFTSNGEAEWAKTVGGTNYEFANTVIQTIDSGYALAGSTGPGGYPDNDIYIVKLNSSGTLQWTRTVGGIYNDEAYSIIQTTEGGYVVAGRTNSFGESDYRMYLVNLSTSGVLVWSKSVSIGPGYSIIKTNDNGYVVSGTTQLFGKGGSDMFIAKFDANGNTCGNSNSVSSSYGTVGILRNTNSTINSQFPTVTTQAPVISSSGELMTICVIGIKPISNDIPKSFSLFQNYPNPFNPTTKIKFDIAKSSFTKLIVYDILGREVTTLINEQLKPGSYEVEWNASQFSSGIYFYSLTTESFNQTKRMVLLK